MPEGYCVKERKKVEIKDAKQVTMKNGRPAIQGVCPTAGRKSSRSANSRPRAAKRLRPGGAGSRAVHISRTAVGVHAGGRTYIAPLGQGATAAIEKLTKEDA